MPRRLVELEDVEMGDLSQPREAVLTAPKQIRWSATYWLDKLILFLLFMFAVLQALLMLVSFEDAANFRGPVKVLSLLNTNPIFMLFAPCCTLVYYRTLYHGADTATAHSTIIRGQALLSGEQLKRALLQSTQTPWIEEVHVIAFTVTWFEFNLVVKSQGRPGDPVVWTNAWTYVSLAFPLALRFLFKQQRMGLIRRERAAALHYVQSTVQGFAAVVTLQIYLMSYMYYLATTTYPLIPYRTDSEFGACCMSINDAYVSAHCNRTWGSGGDEFGHLGSHFQRGFSVQTLECDDGEEGFWSPYRSRNSCCEAWTVSQSFTGRFSAAATTTLVCSIFVMLYEKLIAIDENLAWNNLTSLAHRPRIALIVFLMFCIAMSIPLNIAVMHGSLILPPMLDAYICITLIMVTSFLMAYEFAHNRYTYTKGDFSFRSTTPNGRPVESSLRAALTSCVAALSPGGAKEEASDGVRLTGDVSDLICGKPLDAALGVSFYMKVDRSKFTMPRSGDAGVDAIVREFEQYGTDDDRECVDYVLSRRAGSSDKVFANGNLCRDCDADGRVLDVRLNAVGLARRENGQEAPPSEYGKTLSDFVNDPAAQTANLEVAHVFALRIYTTACFRTINTPLRDTRPTRPPHGLPITVSFIKEAIGKLRAVEASAGDQGVLDLWRGMKNLRALDDFMAYGGTELAPMSCTTDLSVAVQYSLSATSLMLKVHTKTFMQRGADLGFLSAFPGESERTYPPLTFLAPTGRTLDHEQGPYRFMVVEVEPFVG
jgi:hypothetical protein